MRPPGRRRRLRRRPARDSELSPVGKLFFVTVLATALGAALYNIVRGTVVHPRAFGIVLAGFVCFLVGKRSVLARGRWVSFGTAPMSQGMANVYRLGYWLIAVGILATFA